ncbi:MAG: glycosyl hydrolase, partial [bacterium]
SFWVFDDLPVLHQFKDAGGLKAIAETKLFRPEDSYRMDGGGASQLPATATVGRNPANGVVVYYSLKAKPSSDVVLEFLDATGKTLRKFTAKAPKPAPSPVPGSAVVTTPPEQPQAPSGEESESFGRGGAAHVSTDLGLNRFVWDMRLDDAVKFPGMILWAGETRGPRVVPGNYQVKLTADGKTMTESFKVKADPRVAASAADYEKQIDLAMKIRDKLSETNNGIIQIRDVKKQVDDLLKRVKDQPNFKVINEAGTKLKKSLTDIEEALYQTKNQSSQDPLNYPIRLNNKLAALGGVVTSADAAPTDQSYAVYTDLVSQIDAQLQMLAQFMKTEVPAFNQLVKDQNVPAVVVKAPEQPK